MTWLSWIVTVVLDWLFNKIASFISFFIKVKALIAKAHKKNEEIKKEQESANTPKEREDAAKSTIDGF